MTRGSGLTDSRQSYELWYASVLERLSIAHKSQGRRPRAR